MKKKRMSRIEPVAGTVYERAAERFRARLDMTDPAERLMAENYAEKAELLGVVFRAVCEVCDPAGVMPMWRFWYQAVGRETFKLWQGRNRREYAEELELVARKWVVRGLVPELVSRVQAAVIAALDETVR